MKPVGHRQRGATGSIRPQAWVTGAAILALILGACNDASPSPTPPADGAPSTEPSAAPSASAYAGLWVDATAETIGSTADWTNKVEAADINGDGFVDLIFPNGGDYETPGEPVATQVFLNGFPEEQAFTDATTSVMGELVALARVSKVADLNADLIPDIVLGTTYQTQSQLLLGTGGGAFSNATAQLPQLPLSVGDIDIGDVDADGDIDLVLADWGPGSPMENTGGRVRLWLNNGAGTFTDVTDARMPGTLVRFCWELELMDVDNDWDLDLAVSSKRSETSFLFENDGSGTFTDVTPDRLPHFTNNYEFEPMDLDGDGYLDLVTINDGDAFGEHVFRNDGSGAFEDMTAEWWPSSENPAGEDDNNIAFLDVDSDGDADFLVGSLTSADRLMINDGSGHLTLEMAAFNAPISAGTLGMTVADLNNDGRLDVVEAQGENPQAEDERIYLATEAVPRDSSPPVVVTDLDGSASGAVTVHARVHDFMVHRSGDGWTVGVVWDGAPGSAPMEWYGEFLFRTTVSIPVGATGLQVCATDGSGNETCTPAA